MTTTFRLGKILREHKERCGNYGALADDIRRANHGETVDRRKLKTLIEGKSYSLTSRDLKALDGFLRAYPPHAGLAEMPLFERHGVVEELCENDQTVIVLGTYSRQQAARTGVDVWTVRAMSLMVDAITEVKSVPIRIVEEGQALGGRPPNSETQVIGERASSLICLGGPRALSQVAESALATMFNEKPFQRPSASSKRLPIYFVCPSDDLEIDSRFVLHPSDISDPSLAELVVRKKAWAFLTEDEKEPIYFGDQETCDLGLLVVQRRDSGTYVYAGGLSGPGTYGVCQALVEGMASEYERDERKETATFYAVVETPIRVRDDGPGDRRELREKDKPRLRRFGWWPAN